MENAADHYMELFQRLPVACLIVNTVGRPEFNYNAKFLSMVGYTEVEMNEIMNKDYTKVFNEKDMLRLREKLRETRDYAGHIVQEIRLYHKEGRELYAFVESEATEKNDGEYFLCSLVDISELKATQNALEIEKKRLSTVIQCSKDIIFEYDIDCDKMVYYDSAHALANAQEEGILQIDHYSEHLFDGDIVNKEDISKLFPLCRGKELEPVEVRLYMNFDHKNPTWVEMMGTLLKDEKGTPHTSIGVIRDIDEAKQKNIFLKQKAERDSLTNLYNHNSIRLQVDEYLKEGGKDKSNALVVLDLDDFKSVNDTFGHRFGDKVIISVAKMLIDTFGKNDIIGRIGGDEYLVFCKDMLEMTAIQEKLEQLFKTFESNPIGSKEHYQVRASIGVAVSPQDGTSYKRLFDKADRSMYRIKRSGKNTYTFQG